MNKETNNSSSSTRDNSGISDRPGWELQLAREVRNLEREIEPDRDLWAGIERRIAEYPQPKKAKLTPNWMKLGMAASVLMAFSALVLTMVDLGPRGPSGLDMAQEMTSTSSPLQTDAGDMSGLVGPGMGALETMRVEYMKTRDPLIQKFGETNRNLAPETLEELYRNVEIMAEARREIEAQVRNEPTNRRLVEQLMRIHQQELELLKQDFSQPTRSL